ncbi:type I restriction endonuclease subunit R [Corynebacterium liangguodongii]|uniref:Type I restriction enzyme endonuclease subunit n=1 Tax=Corynebacterium liangguodongii TaxID=2079535 RepID=A0A2S0WBE9_9CORY|nr:type I restriction endonuclease subunit R [Corynebacterium liangguodongii]AWB83090.1 DEAD/DEAH box helicase [Corynebacterium liangguodongii]PWB99309.1 type I restriction endonuclease subunit R [Corynebacterium liangguodongii]
MSDATHRKYDPIAVSAESTVVAEYVPDAASETAYQSEAALERELIRLLQSQAYEYLPISSEQKLIDNLRRQLEALNHITFSEEEWQGFFENSIAGKNDGIVEKTVRIQEDHVQLLKRDDGSTKNITLLDKQNIHNNRLQVINQYKVDRAEPADETRTGGRYANRYDVTILVNGLPMVHIELKRRGVDIREAFNQIDRYQRDSFWAGSGLFEYVQLFVISNGTLTKYYSNTTRSQHIKEGNQRGRSRKTSNSFEFTSWWADAQNKPIQDLTSFAKTFFAKHALLNILTKYCVLTADRMLLVMRPYQIVATERILQRIEIATNYKKLGTVEAGGYVWHTTGSGKTLTSFKTAQLASALPSVDKVLFVVDRKDLDYQTMREYDRFQKGAANSNTSTAVLKRQLEDPAARIIITTIQKLSTFIKANKKHPVYDQHVVIIFDECHRSQFGEMHTSITRSFKCYNLFGFTGTPIFAANSGSGGNPQLKTTEQAFGEKLHTYTIVDAITDKNVLPFRIDYVNTIAEGEVADKQVAAIASEEALLSPQRISNIVSYTLEHFDQKTKRTSSYEHSVVTNVVEATRSRKQAVALRKRRRVKGFNAIFATASIDAARRYYNAFQAQNDLLPPEKRLKIGLIYSYGGNEAVDDGILDEEDFDTAALSVDARAFLEDAIQDYNDLFGTSYDTTADRFQNYYKDLSQRLKNRELDLVIVVNMFLTGFDATTLNTLFVDKNLRSHGLIQAYSRTNRILNSVKTYGNIVAFRDLEEETNAALELFGNKDARGVVLLKPYADYYAEYAEKVQELLDKFPLGERIIGEKAQKEFIALFGAILRLENILTSFDEFTGNELLTQRQGQDYRSLYLDLHAEFRNREAVEKEPISDDVVFEIELIKQVEINVDYILMLVEKYREQHGDGQDKEIRSEISRAVDASPSLRSKKDLIDAFVDRVSVDSDVDEAWRAYIAKMREEELGEIITAEGLRPDLTRALIETAFREGVLRTTGTAIAQVLPPVSRFAVSGGHGEKKQRVTQKLQAFFERFYGLAEVRE